MPAAIASPGVLNADTLPAIDDLAAVGVDEAVEHLHQRTLAGAVLTDERVNFAIVETDRHVVQGQEGGRIDFDDAAHLDEIEGRGARGEGRLAPRLC